MHGRALERALERMGVPAHVAAAIAAVVDSATAAKIVHVVREQCDDPPYSPGPGGDGHASGDDEDGGPTAKRARAIPPGPATPPPPPKGAAAVAHRHREVQRGRAPRAKSRLRIPGGDAKALAQSKANASADAWEVMMRNVPPPTDVASSSLPVQGSMNLTKEFRNAWLHDCHRDKKYRSPPCLSPARIARDRKRWELRVFEPWMAAGAVFVAAAWREPIAVGRIVNLVHVESLAQLTAELGPDLAGLGMARTMRLFGCSAVEALELTLDYQQAELDAGIFVLFSVEWIAQKAEPNSGFFDPPDPAVPEVPAVPAVAVSPADQ